MSAVRVDSRMLSPAGRHGPTSPLPPQSGAGPAPAPLTQRPQDRVDDAPQPARPMRYCLTAAPHYESCLAPGHRDKYRKVSWPALQPRLDFWSPACKARSRRRRNMPGMAWCAIHLGR